jgi:hypothetical protein
MSNPVRVATIESVHLQRRLTVCRKMKRATVLLATRMSASPILASTSRIGAGVSHRFWIGAWTELCDQDIGV